MSDSPLVASRGVTFTGLVRSEWLKLRTLRSAVLPLLLAALVVVGLGIVVTADFVAGRDPLPAGTPAFQVTQAAAGAFDRPLSGVLVAQLLLAVVGVVAVTSEFATGTIRTSVLVVQHRGQLLLAKAVVVAVAVTLVCGVAVAIAFVVGDVLLARVGLGSSLSDPRVLAALTGNVATLTGTAVLGLAVGTLLRSGTGAICTVLAAFTVVPLLLPSLPTAGIGGLVQEWWVSQTTVNVVDVANHRGALPGTAGALAFAAWVALAATAAAAAFRRRDV